MKAMYRAITQDELLKIDEDPSVLEDIFYAERSEDQKYSLDIAWDLLHRVLANDLIASPQTSRDPKSWGIYGRHGIGEEDIDFPIAYIDADEVKRVDIALNEITEKELVERVNMEEFNKQLEVYKLSDINNEDAIELVLSRFQELKDFYKNAAEKDLSVFSTIS